MKPFQEQSSVQTASLNRLESAEGDPFFLPRQEQISGSLPPTQDLNANLGTQNLSNAEFDIYETQSDGRLDLNLHSGKLPGLLLDHASVEQFNSRWRTVQIGFVDEPHKSIEQADQIVSDVIERIRDAFNAERDLLKTEWSNEDQVSTEDLRLALQRYRSFFTRLLSV